MNKERYISTLEPAMQEKFRDCESVEDMLTVAKNEGLELPDEALDAVYGGCGTSYTYQIDDYDRCKVCMSRVQLRSVGHHGFPNVYYCPTCFTSKDPDEIEPYYNKRKVVKK